jgi:hypothetical protein
MTTISQQSNAVHVATTFDTDIVVDLGCCTYQRGVAGQQQVEDSIHTLIKRFKPTLLFGFDPHPALQSTVGQVYGTTVITNRLAAWTNDEEVGLGLAANCTHVDLDEVERTKAFDIAAWVRTLPEARIVLKVDVEGAEYVLLPHLIAHGLMDRFSHVLVEWHTGEYANNWDVRTDMDRETILAEIECPVEVWQ